MREETKWMEEREEMKKGIKELEKKVKGSKMKRKE